LAAILVIGCGSKGGGGSVGSVGPGSTSPGGSVAPVGSKLVGPQGFAGTWAVSGSDPLRGAFQGTAVVAPTTSGYSVQKLVTFASALPSGEKLEWAWNATGHDEGTGLRVDASLRVAHVMSTSGSATRTAADKAPRALTALLAAQGVQLGGSFTSMTGAGPQETWVRTTAQAPVFPVTSVQLLPGHAAASNTIKTALSSFFATYWTTTTVAPYVGRPDFDAAIHEVWLDTTALDFYRRSGPGVVLVLDKIVDDIAVAEETRRAHAFSRPLHEKAQLFDADMTATNADQNGMVTAVDQTVSPPFRDFAQSPVLYSGTWALSQLYRYRATGDQEAFDNVVRAATGAAICVDISPDKTQFARAIDFAVNAKPGQVGPAGGKYSWAQGTGTYANLIWMVGGNNDMLHGIDAAFMAAIQILPAGHPVRAQIGAQAASLLGNVKIAQSGDHEIQLAYVAWTATGDPRWQSRYNSALGFRNVLQKAYVLSGVSYYQWQGIADWSGHNLGALTNLGYGLLGGSSPDAAELSWRGAAAKGITDGFGFSGKYRNGIVATAAAGANAPGASDIVKGVLTEIAYPKSLGNATIDYSVASDWSVSPYPSDPWKMDWMQNPYRVQGLYSLPYFYRGGDQNYWNRSPLMTGSTPDHELEPGQDFLVAYWYLRSTGVLGPND
jgi:hypothetical protein